jgi:hypothetical protein
LQPRFSARTLLAMKILGIAVALTALAACSTQFAKLSEADVDAQQKASAQALATRIYEGCNSGTPTPLSESEATPEMRDALAPAKLSATCAGIKSQFGDYQSLDYAETWKPGSGSQRVFRFKGHFSKSADAPEIRVVMDGTKLTGFWLKPWADALR